MSAGPRVNNPELNEALARAIRQLIAEAVETGANPEAKTEAGQNGTASAA
jgi:hypothetical protein